MTGTANAATFAAVFVSLYAAHQVGDHWLQTHHQATVKAARGWVGQLADARHVATLTGCKLAFLAPAWLVLGLQLGPVQLAAGLAVDAVSHWWADRRHTLQRLAELAERIGIGGKATFYHLGTPRPGRDDLPTLGTGAYALDQSWHIGWLFVAALIVAA